MDDLLERVLNFAIALQQIPSPTFNESRRAAFVLKQFQHEGLSDVFMDSIGNVYGRLPGTGTRLPVVVSAHLDTVFPESVDLKIKRDFDQIAGPGIGDNSVGVAGLFGLLWALRQRQIRLPGDLWLVANVGEEGLGDLCGIIAVVDRFGEGISAYIILEGMALGQVYHRGLGVQRYRVTVQTAGGHSWVDYGRPSAVHELAQLINRLTAMSLPAQPRTTLNVGVIRGGTTINTIAAEAHLELDLRSEDSQALANLVGQVETLIAASNRFDVRCESKGGDNWQATSRRNTIRSPTGAAGGRLLAESGYSGLPQHRLNRCQHRTQPGFACCLRGFDHWLWGAYPGGICQYTAAFTRDRTNRDPGAEYFRMKWKARQGDWIELVF